MWRITLCLKHQWAALSPIITVRDKCNPAARHASDMWQCWTIFDLYNSWRRHISISMTAYYCSSLYYWKHSHCYAFKLHEFIMKTPSRIILFLFVKDIKHHLHVCDGGFKNEANIDISHTTLCLCNLQKHNRKNHGFVIEFKHLSPYNSKVTIPL